MTHTCQEKHFRFCHNFWSKIPPKLLKGPVSYHHMHPGNPNSGEYSNLDTCCIKFKSMRCINADLVFSEYIITGNEAS